MSKRASDLLSICDSYINGTIDAEQYKYLFNEYYIQYEDEMEDSELALFDSIYIANELYQPDEKIRKSEEAYIDEGELRSTITSSLFS